METFRPKQRTVSVRTLLNNNGNSLPELIFTILILCSLYSAALISSAKNIQDASLHAEASLIQNMLSNVISSAYLQNSRITISISSRIIRIYRNMTLIDQHKVHENVYLSRANQLKLSEPWLEDVYPGGSQSPFTLQVNGRENICLVTVSLRGRVNRKCL